jgi:hypothetical protein
VSGNLVISGHALNGLPVAIQIHNCFFGIKGQLVAQLKRAAALLKTAKLRLVG